MARTTQILPTVSADRGIELLRDAHEKGQALLQDRTSSESYSKWEIFTRGVLTRAFGSVSPNVSQVMDVGKYGSRPMNAPDSWWDEHRRVSLEKQLRLLEGLIELLELDTDGEIRTAQKPKAPTVGKKVFIVHGHDQAALQSTARFAEKIGLEPIILHEQPNAGRTIIEKFIDYSDVGFAIILLTSDDHGGPISEKVDDLKPRARQNVILELGYFLGTLGRNRVCALYKEGVEIPSDYSGVLFVKLDDSGAWRLELAREIKAAGFDVDMNQAV